MEMECGTCTWLPSLHGSLWMRRCEWAHPVATCQDRDVAALFRGDAGPVSVLDQTIREAMALGVGFQEGYPIAATRLLVGSFPLCDSNGGLGIGSLL